MATPITSFYVCGNDSPNVILVSSLTLIGPPLSLFFTKYVAPPPPGPVPVPNGRHPVDDLPIYMENVPYIILQSLVLCASAPAVLDIYKTRLPVPLQSFLSLNAWRALLETYDLLGCEPAVKRARISTGLGYIPTANEMRALPPSSDPGLSGALALIALMHMAHLQGGRAVKSHLKVKGYNVEQVIHHLKDRGFTVTPSGPDNYRISW